MFNKAKKQKRKHIEFLMAVSDYVREAMKIGMTDEEIRKGFKDRRYASWVIDFAFKINERGLDKMVKKKKEKEEEEFEDEDDFEDEDEDDEDIKPEIKKKSKPEIKELTKSDIQQALLNHEQRLTNVEGWIYRVKSQ